MVKEDIEKLSNEDLSTVYLILQRLNSKNTLKLLKLVELERAKRMPQWSGQHNPFNQIYGLDFECDWIDFDDEDDGLL